MTCPCKGCTDREIGCHSKCSEYVKWRAGYEDKQNKIKDIKYKNIRHMDYIVESVQKCKKGRR